MSGTHSEKREQDWVVTGIQVIGDTVEEHGGGPSIFSSGIWRVDNLLHLKR